MSGNNCCNKNVFSRWRKVAIDGDHDWTWTGGVPDATGNERWPMVVRRYDGTNSSTTIKRYSHDAQCHGRQTDRQTDDDDKQPITLCSSTIGGHYCASITDRSGAYIFLCILHGTPTALHRTGSERLHLCVVWK